MSAGQTSPFFSNIKSLEFLTLFIAQLMQPIINVFSLQEYDNLAEAEQFAISISGIKRLVPRLKSLLFQQRYPELVQDCKPHIVSATAACKEVKESKKFAKILEFVLLIGTYEQGPGNRGGLGGRIPPPQNQRFIQ